MKSLLQLLFFVFSLLLIQSCKSKINCEHEKQMFQEEWNGVIVDKLRDHKWGAYKLIMSNGQEIWFSPVQELYSIADIGDSISKKQYSLWATLYTLDKDTFECSFSVQECDSVVLKEFGYKYDSLLNLVKINKPKKK